MLLKKVFLNELFEYLFNQFKFSCNGNFNNNAVIPSLLFDLRYLLTSSCLLPQKNWPEGHLTNVQKLIAFLEKRNDFNLTKLNWSTGIILATKTT